MNQPNTWDKTQTKPFCCSDAQRKTDHFFLTKNSILKIYIFILKKFVVELDYVVDLIKFVVVVGKSKELVVQNPQDV